MTKLTRPIDRAAYEASRHAELERIRQLDAHFRRGVAHSCSLAGEELEQLCYEERRTLNEEALDHMGQHRLRMHAVEGHLLGCMELSYVTGEILLARATSTDDMIARVAKG